MVENTPLISIITCTYNAALTFEETIKSIASQDLVVEFIVIDGGSTDGTVEIAKKYQDVISVFISEPDKGIYDAMNKGIDRATGEWIFFLGADDLLINGILAKILPHLQLNRAVVYGDVLLDNGAIFHSHIGIRCLFENRLHHQSAFYRKELFNDFRYNQRFRNAADYELTLKVYLQKQPVLYVPYIISIFSTGGYSSESGVGVKVGIADVNHIRKLYVQNSLVNFVLSNLLKAYYPYMHVRGRLIAKLRKALKIERARPNLKYTHLIV